jgi:hypothetical protein
MIEPTADTFLQNVAVTDLKKEGYTIRGNTVYSDNAIIFQLGPPRSNSTLKISKELEKYPGIRGLYERVITEL